MTTPAESSRPTPRAMAGFGSTTIGFCRLPTVSLSSRGQSFRFTGVNIRGLVHYGDKRTLEHSEPGHQEEAESRPHLTWGACGAASSWQACTPMPTRPSPACESCGEDGPPALCGPLRSSPALPTSTPMCLFRIPGDEGFYGRYRRKLERRICFQPISSAAGYHQHYLPLRA